MTSFILKVNESISDYFSRFLSLKDLRANPDKTIVVLEKSNAISVDFSKYYIKSTPYWKGFSNLKSDPIFFAEIDNPTLVTKGIVLNNASEVILESTIFQEEYLNKLCNNHFVVFRRFLPTIKTRKIIPLLNKLDNNYYHWSMETLLRVLLVYEKEDFKDYKLVVKKDGSKFMVESLRFLFQITEYQLLPKGLLSKVVAEKALVISFPHIRNQSTSMANVYYPSIIRKMNQLAQRRLMKHTFESISKYGKNLMISRENALERRVVNIASIREALKSFGISIVLLEGLSFIEQVALFAQAEKVVAVHGAGITNVLYASNLSLLEFFPKERNIRDAFYFTQITAALELEHRVIEYPSVNKEQDLFVDDSYLEKINKFILQK